MHLKPPCCTHRWVTALWEPHKDTTELEEEEEGRRETVSAQLSRGWSTHQEVKSIPPLAEAKVLSLLVTLVEQSSSARGQ